MPDTHVHTEGAVAASAGKPISFLSTEEIVVHGKKQWAQWSHDHFQYTAEGWSHTQVDGDPTLSSRIRFACTYSPDPVDEHVHLSMSHRFVHVTLM